jgi:LPS sulfotransferase NodH
MKLDSEQFNRLETDAEQACWLAEFYELGTELPSARLIGSKQNVLAIRDFEATRKRLMEHSIRLVRLRRDNVVKTAISQMRAEQYADKTERETGKRLWAVKSGSERLGPTELDPEILFRRIELIENLQSRLMSGFASSEVLDLEYEEINRCLDETATKLCSFLNIKSKPQYRVPHSKATPDDVWTSIANLSAVESKLAPTRYANMLFDG